MTHSTDPWQIDLATGLVLHREGYGFQVTSACDLPDIFDVHYIAFPTPGQVLLRSQVLRQAALTQEVGARFIAALEASQAHRFPISPKA